MINLFEKFEERLFAIKNAVFARILTQFEAYHEILREGHLIFTQSAELEAAERLAGELHAMHAEQTKYAKLLELGLVGSVVTNAVLLLAALGLLLWILKDTSVDAPYLENRFRIKLLECTFYYHFNPKNAIRIYDFGGLSIRPS